MFSDGFNNFGGFGSFGMMFGITQIISILMFVLVFGVILFTMRIKINNPFLNVCGDYLFEIYILQRIPMILLSYYGLAKSSLYVYLLLIFVITLILSYYINKFMSLLKKKIYKLN